MFTIMKKISFILAVLAMTFVFAACGGGNSTPKATAETYCESMKSGDFDAIIDMMDYSGLPEDKVKETKEFTKMMAEEKIGKKLEKTGGIDKWEIGEEKISEDGKSATVKIKFIYKDGSDENTDVHLVSTDDGWKLKG